MKITVFLFLLFILIGRNSAAQNSGKSKSFDQSQMDTLKIKLSGVKFFEILTSQEERDIMKQIMGNPGESVDLQILNGIVDYANKDLELGLIYTNEQLQQSFKYANSICDYVFFSYSIGAFKSDFMAIGKLPIEFTFIFCDNSEYKFKKTIGVNGSTNYRLTIRNLLSNTVNKKISFKKTLQYDSTSRLSIQKKSPVINYPDFISYLDSSKSLSKYEGLFELFHSENTAARLKLGIYNDKGVLKLLYFGGSHYKNDWNEGELKGILTLTKSESDLLVKLYDAFKFERNFAMKFSDSNAFDLISLETKSTDRYVRIK